MLQSLSEKLTTQFYQWEQLGRGWSVFDVPVDLEPAFEPFFFHVPERAEIIDDGKRPTIFSILGGSLRNLFKSEPRSSMETSERANSVQAFQSFRNFPLYFIKVTLPKNCTVPLYETEQFLLMLSMCQSAVSFEIVATADKIMIQFVSSEKDVFHLKNQLKVYFPTSTVTEGEDALLNILDDELYILDFGFSDEYMRPLSMANTLDPDPFLSLFGMLDTLEAGRSAAVQVLFQRTINPWAESMLRSVTTKEGGSFFEDAPEMVALAKQKTSAPLFAAVIRTVGSAADETIAKHIARSMGESVIHFSKSPANKLIPLRNDDYEYDSHLTDVFLRQSRRLGMLVNSRELACFVHLPSASILSCKLECDSKRTKAAPTIAAGHTLVIGANVHTGKESVVTLSNAQRLKHTHIVGATGTGKTTLLLNMILQDVRNGNALAVLDPHGDLIEKILDFIPEQRMKEVVVIDPSDADFPVGFNILSAHSEIEKDILSSDLVAAFRKYSSSWGDQMNSVFANAILAFLESTKGGTIADLRRFLVEKSFRDVHLKTVTDPSVVYYWQKEYPFLKSNSIGSILTRLDSFLRPKIIRNMVAQNKSINFENLIDTNKIILVKLSHGLIGAENSYLLGTFIVSKLHQAAMARQSQMEGTRKDFFFYIDEFQHFVTSSMSSILSGARKYHFGLVLAHQSLQQISQDDSEVASSVIANAGTRICFRVGEFDSKKLENGFSFFEAKDLQNLPTGEAIMRIDTPEQDFNVTATFDASTSFGFREQIIEQSRSTYGTPRQEVEALLFKSMGMANEKEFPKEKVAGKKQEQTKNITSPTNEQFEAHTKSVEEQPKSQKPPNKEFKAQTFTTKPEEIIGTPQAEEYIEQTKQRLHHEWKRRIKKMAEDRHFISTIEAPTPDGKGFVDVSLERNNSKIACEVSVTTGAAWELHNVTKCLAAGYDTVVVCVIDKKGIDKIRSSIIQGIQEPERAKVLILEPDALFEYLDTLVVQDAGTESYIKGRRVKVEYKAIPALEADQKGSSIKRVLGKSNDKRDKK